MEVLVYKVEIKRARPYGHAPVHNNAKNDLEATALQEVGKLELIVAEVRKLGATDVAGRSGLSRAGGRSVQG